MTPTARFQILDASCPQMCHDFIYLLESEKAANETMNQRGFEDTSDFTDADM